MSKDVRFALSVSPELAQRLEDMAKQEHTTKSEIIRKALAVMTIALDNKKVGNRLAVVDKSGSKVSDILGL